MDLVDISHPIEPISINDAEAERPSAQELCHQLAKLRQEEQYSENVQQAQHSNEKFERLKEEHQRLAIGRISKSSDNEHSGIGSQRN